MTKHRHPLTARGFTLVEMLVALAIFAILSLGALALLRTSLASQHSVTRALDVSAATIRARAMMANALAAAQPQLYQNEAALIGGADTMTLSSAMDGQLVRARFMLADGALVRSRADGSGTARLIDGVTSLRFSYRAADGRWVSHWPAGDMAALPRAVAIHVEGAGGNVDMVFLVAPGPVA
ncbi:MAG: prepilin-type N-terminal cleavage/methylation domain-containing protein [Sphingomonadaceae bacterium]|nr:prepilin-type N-terminal cleavage/methylation domain-containing protein [Sphingomonadaceae bacterium]